MGNSRESFLGLMVGKSLDHGQTVAPNLSRGKWIGRRRKFTRQKCQAHNRLMLNAVGYSKLRNKNQYFGCRCESPAIANLDKSNTFIMGHRFSQISLDNP